MLHITWNLLMFKDIMLVFMIQLNIMIILISFKESHFNKIKIILIFFNYIIIFYYLFQNNH